MDEFAPDQIRQIGLLVCAGGFEDRATAFTSRLRACHPTVENALVLRYRNLRKQNGRSYAVIRSALTDILGRPPRPLIVDAARPILAEFTVRRRIAHYARRTVCDRALVDISGMTHMLALGAIDACLSSKLDTSVIYTEAESYYPLQGEMEDLAAAWHRLDYETAAGYLQSSGLRAVHILPAFSGNFRPGHHTCLIVFVGYEPNRIQGLIDGYAPGALTVVYGEPPRPELQWRTQLSRELHESVVAGWQSRELSASTLDVDSVLSLLEAEYQATKEQYDVAVAAQCSKMQAVASYLFWRRHPETQLLFTSPVSFKPERYSRGAGRTYIYRIC